MLDGYKAEPYLEPGEQVWQVIRARYGYWIPPALSYTITMVDTHSTVAPFGFRLIVVTDRSILQFKTSWRYQVQEMLARLPRDRLIGPLNDQWTKVPTVGAKLYVHRKFLGVVAEADHELWNTRSDWSYDEAMALKTPAPEFM